ncbi:hypothetical protein SteCoe_35037 [Stentor coeruleus]|uniref:C2 NT-type domain-containing protein n=1 Tax=Stentor coeruleus TaxID=5963 RepID=A0A1R2AT77_9CILI|nr:hypothetical protein SteCoe_35037 [Stentor coeruleus]
MSALIQKIGAEKVRHHLEIDIHYVRIKLADSFPILVEVLRGKKMHKETQPLNYSPSQAYVQFDYPLAFDITMHKKGSSYVKKNFCIKLFQINGKNRINNGRVKIDFSHIPVIKKPIIRREVPLQHCSDKTAVVSISVKLDQIGKVRGTLGAGLSPNSSLLSPNSSIISPNSSIVRPEKKNLPEFAVEKMTISDTLPKNEEKKVLEKDKKLEIPKEKVPVPRNSGISLPEITIETQEEPYTRDEHNESFNSKMSFSDLILNPNESELSSESSSSEEEAKELPVEKLVAHSVPKTTREQVTPNEGSKSQHIAVVEARAGITTRREGNCCNACVSF